MDKDTIFLIIVIISFIFVFFILLLERKKNKQLQDDNDKLKNEKALIEEENKKQAKDNAILQEKLTNLLDYKQKYEQILKENIKDKEQIRHLNTKIEQIEKYNEEKIKFLQDSEEKLTNSFKALANQILEENNKKFKLFSDEKLNNLINPLQQDIKTFKEQIEKLSKNETITIEKLQYEIKSLKELNTQLSNEANNLATALTNKKHIQGSWGEIVLEHILELSGLREGYEYKKQVGLKDEENKLFKPDIIVYLPNNREVIIDSKVTLNAYTNYISSADEQKEYYLKEHIKNIKHHINELAKKEYENLKGINSLDFIFMFVPIENALNLALEKDVELFEYAFKNKIILVTPSTLLISLRAIESSWRYEKQVKNIEDIIKMVSNLYDKIRGFVEDFEKIEEYIQKAHKSYEGAKNKLTIGRGNVIRQIEQIKQKSGINPKKTINKELIDNSLS